MTSKAVYTFQEKKNREFEEFVLTLYKLSLKEKMGESILLASRQL